MKTFLLFPVLNNTNLDPIVCDVSIIRLQWPIFVARVCESCHMPEDRFKGMNLRSTDEELDSFNYRYIDENDAIEVHFDDFDYFEGVNEVDVDSTWIVGDEMGEHENEIAAERSDSSDCLDVEGEHSVHSDCDQVEAEQVVRGPGVYGGSGDSTSNSTAETTAITTPLKRSFMLYPVLHNGKLDPIACDLVNTRFQWPIFVARVCESCHMPEDRFKGMNLRSTDEELDSFNYRYIDENDAIEVHFDDCDYFEGVNEVDVDSTWIVGDEMGEHENEIAAERSDSSDCLDIEGEHSVHSDCEQVEAEQEVAGADSEAREQEFGFLEGNDCSGERVVDESEDFTETTDSQGVATTAEFHEDVVGARRVLSEIDAKLVVLPSVSEYFEVIREIPAENLSLGEAISAMKSHVPDVLIGLSRERLDAATLQALELSEAALQYEDGLNGMNLHQAAALRLYTADFMGETNLYSLVNNNLRTRHALPAFVPFIWLLLHGMKKCPMFTGTHVYRSINIEGEELTKLLSRYRPNMKHRWYCFTSTSAVVNVQERFLGESVLRDENGREHRLKKGVMFHIHVRPGARIISEYSNYPDEEEILLPPNFTFEVVASSSPVAGLHILQLRELEPDDFLLDLNP